MGGVILELGALPESWEPENTLEDLRRSRRAHFGSSTTLIVPGIWASQPGNLLAIAPSAPTTTGITSIFTFHSYSSSMTDIICQFF